MKRTPLYERHVALGAKMVDFAGWAMPLSYGSQIDEHHAVRRDAGLFDVSHMAVVDVQGAGARDCLRGLLANDVARLAQPGAALYTCMLNEQAGVVDDLIVYLVGDGRYRAVVNAGTREKDLAWMRARAAGAAVSITERTDLAMVAVQGPNAREKSASVLPAALRERAGDLAPFHAVWDDDGVFVARTGYTGEDGYEIMVPGARADDFAGALLSAGVSPAGLGARDTLRLEAGLNLYGSDMDDAVTPLESGLAWTVAWDPADRDFVGRAVLEEQRRAGVDRRRMGLVLEAKGVLRNHQRVVCGEQDVGEVTSGGFSPTLGRAVALARVDSEASGALEVEIRGRRLPVRTVKPPFARNGKSCIE